MAVSRVYNRVMEGGHNIPEDVIRRRFEGGLRNFNQVYKVLVDKWALWDNAEGYAILLEEGEGQ